MLFLFWWHFFVKREKEENETSKLKDKPKHPFLFSVFTTAFIAFIIRPAFTISFLTTKNLSGLIITLNKTLAEEDLTIIYLILSAVFVFSYLAFRDLKKANIVPYGTILLAIVYITGLYILSFFNRPELVDLTTIRQAGIISQFNALVYSIIALIYLCILLFSLYALIGEFLMLIREEFQHNKIYKKLMLLLYSHKIQLTEQQKYQIKNYMEQMLEQGEEEYLIIEQIHEKTHLPLRSISALLHELEEDDEQKEHYHYINHYHHNIEHIKKLYKIIKHQYYKQRLDAEAIIDNCLKQGWSQDDIAAG